MTTRITGIVRDLEGQPLVNSHIRFERRSGVRAQDGATVVPRVVNAKTDSSGNIAVDLYPGEYSAQAERGSGALSFKVGVPDDVAQVQLQDLIDQIPSITPTLVSETRQARDQAVEAAESAEDDSTAAAASASAASESEAAAEGAQQGAEEARDEAEVFASVSPRVIYVATIADLQALSTDSLPDGQQVSVTDQATGGVYRYDESASSGGIAPDEGPGQWFLTRANVQGKQYDTRAAFVSDVAAGYAPADGTVVSAGGLQYMLDPTAGDPIPDLPGFVPAGDAEFSLGHFGADASALSIALEWSAASRRRLHAVTPETLVVDEFTFPSGCLSTDDSFIDLTYSGGSYSGDAPIIIEGGCRLPCEVAFRTDGNVTSGPLVHVLQGEPVKIGKMKLSDDDLSSESTAVTVFNSGFDCDNFVSKNFGRPLAVFGSDNEPCTKVTIREIVITNYIRGISLAFVEDFFSENLFTSVRHPSAQKTGGHNGILLSSARNIRFDYVDISDPGEHAFRIGGNSSFAGSMDTDNIFIESFIARKTGGCAFKVNPNSGQKARNIYVGSLIGYDISDGETGGNAELLRLTRAENCVFPSVASYWIDRSGDRRPVRNALRTCEVENTHIGSLVADATNNPMISFEEETDSAEAGPNGVFINSVSFVNQHNPTELVRFENSSFTPRNIYIRNVNATNISGEFGAIFWASSANTLTDPILVQGQIEILGGSALVSETRPEGDLAWMDIRSGNKSLTMPMRFFSSTPDGIQLSSETFTGSDSPANGLTISSFGSTAEQDGFGGSLSFLRPGSGRRGGSVAIQQVGSSVQDTALVFYAGSSQAASDALSPLFSASRSRIESLRNGSPLVLRSPNGTRYALSVDDAGDLSVTAV